MRTAERIGLPPKRTTTPAAKAAKVEVRRLVLAAIGADQAQVLDAFAGEGDMYRAIWKEAAGYVGCDVKYFPSGPKAYVGDNRRVLRTIDLAAFNVFDFDAYGSPWDAVYILASRRKLKPGEMIGVVLTEGQQLKMQMGGMSIALAQLAGVKAALPGLGRAQGDLIRRAITRIATMMGGRITRRWEAVGKGGSVMHYVGLVLEGRAVGKQP